MDWLELLYEFLPWVIGIVIGIFGAYFAIFKGKVDKIAAFVKVLQDALEDNAITKEELKSIVAAFKAIL